MPALENVGFEYRPPIQTRHTFATMMLSAGEDIGWVQNMLGHSSLQMIFTRYYAWIPKKTRQDGASFMEASAKSAVPVDARAKSADQSRPEKVENVIHLFEKNDPIPTHPTKKGQRRFAVSL